MYSDPYTIFKDNLVEKLHDKLRADITAYFQSEALIIEIKPYECDFKFVKLYYNFNRRVSEGITSKDLCNEIVQNYKNFLRNKFFRFPKRMN